MAIDRVKTRANAEKLLRANRIPEAIRELQKLAEDNPHDIQVLNQIGNLYLRLGNKDAAVPMFIKVAELFSKNGFATKAVASLKIVTREQPENLSAWQMLASLSEQQGFAREAWSAYERVAELVGQSGNLDGTISVQRKLLDLEPENLKVRVQLGDSLIKAGRKDEGIKQYVKAGGQLTTQGHVREAARMYERAIELDPNNIATLEGVVKSHVAQQQGQLALQVLDTILERNPKAEAILLLKVEVLSELKQFRQAEEACLNVLRADPNSTAALSRLTRLLVVQKRYDDAARVLSGVLGRVREENLPDLEALFEEVNRFAPDNLGCLKGLGEIFRRSGQTGRLVGILMGVADAATKQGQTEEAREALRELVKLEPQKAEFSERLKALEGRMGLSTQPAPKSPAQTSAPAATEAATPEAPEIQVQVDETGEAEIEIAMDDLEIPKLDVTASMSRPGQRFSQAIRAEEEAEEAVSQAKAEEVPAAAPPRALDAREAEVIREQLTEAEVFLKYGLTEKAITELQSILKKVPDHVHAHQKLIAIFKNQKRTDKLVRQILSLAQVFRGQGDQETFETLLEEARAIDPNHKALRAIGEAEEEIAVPVTVEEPRRGESFPELDLGLPGPPAKKKAPQKKEEPEIVISLDLEEPAGAESGSYDTSNSEQMPPLMDEQLVPEPEPGEEAPGPSDEEEGVVSLEESLSVELTPQEVAEENTIEEMLEEAEFYLSQELFGEAQRALQALESRWPSDARVVAFRERMAGGPHESEELVEISLEEDEEAPAVGEDTASQLELYEPAEVQEEMSLEAAPEGGGAPSSLEEPKGEAVSWAGEGPPVLADEVEGISLEEAGGARMEPGPESAAMGEESEALAESQEAAVLSEEAQEEQSTDSSGVFESNLQDALTELTAPPKSRTKLKVSLKELLPEEAEATQVENAEGAEDEYYDLASELGAALDGLQAPEETLFDEEGKSPEEMSFEEVFEEFKRGVEKKVSEEDYATHYNLGIAYKEMELLDEAIGEFQMAARSPEFFVECCSMLGLCFRQKGMGELAEKWYRKGIAAPGFAEEVYAGLKYDLAETLLEENRAQDAGELFREVYAVNANYRDIKDRIKKLS